MTDSPIQPPHDQPPPDKESTAAMTEDLYTTSDTSFEDVPSPARPRSIRRRLAIQDQPSPVRASRVRSQPLQVEAPTERKRVREPLPLEWEPEPATGAWRAKPFVVGLAAFAWLVALALLLTDPGQLPQAGWEARVLLLVVWMLAAALTFVPVQWRLAIPGVGWQGILGFGLLGYLLAFVPAPSAWLLDLPDLPVYLLLFFAVFYAVTAAVVPLTYLFGRRFYKLRVHRLDVGRARRQAYEIGLLTVATLVMAGLRVLSLATFGLLVLVIILTEALLLSQMQPEG